MWIFFSPSEKKLLTSAQETKNKGEFYKEILSKGLKEALEEYVKFLQTESEAKIAKSFGVKKIDLEELSKAQNLFNAPLLEAILRYCGVAFVALDYQNLPKNAQEYIKKRVLIFSNLFGILRAGDKIPYYDLKQGEGFYDFNTKKFYAKSVEIYREFLKSQKEILDLRAGFYQQCFKIFDVLDKEEVLVYEPVFIKNQKVVSHYAKHYRGILLKECAKAQLQVLRDLQDLQIDGLELVKIEREEQKTKLIYEVR
ncbi:YaaA family protein [Helicobacter burdigaliensis]|uniref:YaaA family protein n=1 Tax=Helicobacter burdigaliensis TaxID=2315334 RepID=UPI000EF71CA9|nr:YaaA family protein [Helicobacter burdigaliensis]